MEWLWKSETMIWSCELIATKWGPANLPGSLGFPRDPNRCTNLPFGWKTITQEALLSTTTKWPERLTAMPLGPEKLISISLVLKFTFIKLSSFFINYQAKCLGYLYVKSDFSFSSVFVYVGNTKNAKGAKVAKVMQKLHFFQHFLDSE